MSRPRYAALAALVSGVLASSAAPSDSCVPDEGPGAPPVARAHQDADGAPPTRSAAAALLEASALLEAPELPAIVNPEPALPPAPRAYECLAPPVEVPHTRPCARGGSYPACRAQMPTPRAAGGIYARWRNTTEERWWGRPALVGILLAAAREFHRLHPEQRLAIGDLDAIGPRHATHDRGVDVDLYLPGAMVTENEGTGQWPWNYWDVPPKAVEGLRWRVEELARVLATCTQGRLRIYYNDPVVEQRFAAWYREQGYRSPFGAPIQPHNELHQFHFHVTIEDDAPAPGQLIATPTER